jgi:hypothetical protein
MGHMEQKRMKFDKRISAEDIIEKLTQPPEKRDEPEERGKAEGPVEPVYTLRHKSVEGKLDLKHRTIEIAVDIQDCEFLDEVDLRYCEFKQVVDFSKCFFKAKVNFSNVKCAGTGRFDNATFGGEVDFYSASFGGDLFYWGASFKGKATFTTLACEDSAFFDPATFEGEVDFTRASFGGGSYCQGANFERYVNLYQSKIGVLSLDKTLPFRQDSRVNLRECQFDRFSGSPKVAKGMAKRQKPEEFSRDPYLQLEKYYRGVGNELEAKRMHYKGRSELRKNAWTRGKRAAEWPLGTKLADASIWLLTGYGVRTYLLLIPIFFFLSGSAQH